MRRLAAGLVCEVRLQHRNGFYWAVAFVMAFWMMVATQLPALDWVRLLPVVVLNNLLITAFFFVGGLVLLEQAEGSLQARMVTPLRPGEYLAAKIVTLGVLGLVENLVIVAAVARRLPALLPFVAGTLLAGSMLGLLGIVVVSRYDSINEYLMPAAGFTTLVLLPVLPYFGVATSRLWYLHPTQAPLVLLRAGFVGTPAWELMYGVLYSLAGCGVLFLAARRAFEALRHSGGAAG
jgi:fluoroquinolone transport system permease protein